MNLLPLHSVHAAPLTGSHILPSPLWNPEAVKQIVKWHVSTFRQTLKPRTFFPQLHKLHTTWWLESVPA